jgi:hypothetical protein
MKYVVNGNEYEIKTVIHFDQCDAYYKALEDGDTVLAQLLYLPPHHVSYETIKSRMETIDLIESYKAEMKRIEEMPEGMLKVEAELGFYK